MSYMVTIKGKEGIVTASDSYSCYYTRNLKDSNYQKIHEIIPNHFYIAQTGLNVLYDNQDNYIDVSKAIKQIFKKTTSKNIKKQINKFSRIMKESCDNFGVDATVLFAYDEEMYVTDIIHQIGMTTNYWGKNEYDIIFMGEDYHKTKARGEFSQQDMFQSLDINIQKCKNSVLNQIEYEATLFEEGQRIVGGNIQYSFIRY